MTSAVAFFQQLCPHRRCLIQLPHHSLRPRQCRAVYEHMNRIFFFTSDFWDVIPSFGARPARLGVVSCWTLVSSLRLLPGWAHRPAEKSMTSFIFLSLFAFVLLGVWWFPLLLLLTYDFAFPHDLTLSQSQVLSLVLPCSCMMTICLLYFLDCMYVETMVYMPSCLLSPARLEIGGDHDNLDTLMNQFTFGVDMREEIKICQQERYYV